MLSSLFEVYDPYTYVLTLSVNWLLMMFLIMFLWESFWVINSRVGWLIFVVINYISVEFNLFVNKSAVKKGGILFFVSLYFYIFVVNLLGLMPYVFSSSAHLIYSISLSLPLWLSIIVMGWLNFVNNMFCHLVPVGTPLLLIPLMVVIETISNFIRPWSLSVRLMANMVSGHLLMSLLGDCGLLFILVQLILFFFEFFVCFIQSYVFSALTTLYVGEI